MKDTDVLELPMEFTDRAHEALVSVWWTGNLLRRAARRLFRSMGSSEAHFNTLILLRELPGPLTQNDLSRKLLVDKANVTGLVDQLERAGMLTRSRVPGDRRSYHVGLTARGRRHVDRLERAYRRAVGQAMTGLTRADQSALIKATGKLRAALARAGLAG
jgi:DNA-binding MarR family transcriptional regulator